MSEDFLDNVEREGADPFKGLEKDTPSESLTEKEPEVEKPAGGKVETPEENLPFHKDPRWIKREEELKELRERDEAREREIAELKSFREEAAQKLNPTGVEIPDWFKELYGDNAVAWQKYSEREALREQEITNRVLMAQQQQAAHQQAEEAKWNKWVDDELEKLTASGKTFDKNKLLKVMMDYGPTTGNSFDFQKGYAIYEKLEGGTEQEKSDARKQLADTTTKTSKHDSKTKDYMTPAELRNLKWGSL